MSVGGGRGWLGGSGSCVGRTLLARICKHAEGVQEARVNEQGPNGEKFLKQNVHISGPE